MRKTHLTVIARILAESEKRDLVRFELSKLINATRAEEGNMNYDLHEDNKNPNLFLMYENWTNRELWQKHMDSDHIKEYITATEGAVREFEVYEMTQIR